LRENIYKRLCFYLNENVLCFRENRFYEEILFIHGTTQERHSEKARSVRRRPDDELATSVKRGANQ